MAGAEMVEVIASALLNNAAVGCSDVMSERGCNQILCREMRLKTRKDWCVGSGMLNHQGGVFAVSERMLSEGMSRYFA